MTLLEWRKEFETGIAGVDHEHQQLVDSINRIYSMLDAQADKQVVLNCLGDIYGKIAGHFMLEERLMKKYDYDQLEEHRQDHAKLLDEIGEISDEAESASKLDSDLLRKKLTDWFQVHFQTHDARLHKLQALIESGEQDKGAIKKLMARLF